jgi:phytoene synthase
MNRTQLVAAAGEAIRHGSKSFHMASRLFDRETRERAWLLYCWCRHCDDVCDGQSLGFAAAPAPAADSVQDLEFLTGCVLAGERTGLLPFDALAVLLEECPVPRRYILDHVRGFALDAEGWRPRDEADLLRYCYHVAGAVGCMMAVVMGVPPEEEETLARASDLGIAFQLSNIARDLRDDHEAGRCYLPAEWIELHGLDRRDPLRPDRRDALVAVAGRLTSLALRYEASAHAGVAKLPFRARWAVLAAARVYGAIGRRVTSLGAAAWETRVIVPRREKLSFLLPALVEAIRTR